MRHSYNFIDITGQRFGRLVVLRYAPEWKVGYWRVRCDCGTEFFTEGRAMRTGRTRSCGCLRQDFCRELGKGGYGVGKRFRQLLATKETPDGVRRIPGTSATLANIFELSRSCINAHVRSGKPVKGYTIRLQTPTP